MKLKATKKKFTLIIPFSEHLFKKLNGNPFIVRTHAINVDEIKNELRKYNKQANSILIDYRNENMNFISFDESWKDLELTILLSEIGSFKNLIAQRPILQKLNIKFLFPASQENSYHDVRILSSLGIHCGVYFDDVQNVLWNEFSDLADYYLKSRIEQAPIEPLSFLKFHYETNNEIDFNTIFYNNPDFFLYVSENEDVATSFSDFSNQKYIARGIDNIDGIQQNEAYKKSIIRKEDFFQNLNECSTCPAWNICMGKFNQLEDKKTTCSKVFTNIINLLENRQVKKVAVLGKK